MSSVDCVKTTRLTDLAVFVPGSIGVKWVRETPGAESE